MATRIKDIFLIVSYHLSEKYDTQTKNLLIKKPIRFSCPRPLSAVLAIYRCKDTSHTLFSDFLVLSIFPALLPLLLGRSSIFTALLASSYFFPAFITNYLLDITREKIWPSWLLPPVLINTIIF